MSKNDELLVIDTKKAAAPVAPQPELPKVPLFELVPEDDPILLEVLPEFDFANPPVDPNTFASSLTETCIANKGIGLSANQCGFKHRVFVMGAGEDYMACFNPKVISHSTDSVMMEEGCLSFPMLPLKIARSSEIVVEYQNYLGEVKSHKLTGISARCFLHELDHMNGIVYTSRAKPLALEMGRKKRMKTRKLYDRAKASMKQLETVINGYTN
jgi:peptide deformylase